MNDMQRLIRPRTRQRGALTVFAAILILFLITVLLVYSARSSLVDQRIAGNEHRQKVAFNIAEGASSMMLETILAYGAEVTSFDGWRDTTNGIWDVCAGEGYCIEPPLDPAETGYFLHDVGSVLPEFQTAVDQVVAGQPNATARVSLAMQFAEEGGVIIGPPGPGEELEARALFMVYAYGYSDCADVTDLSTCQGEARIAQPLSTARGLSGTPDVPLVSKSTFPPSGTAEIAGNPNAGGPGVTVTAWLNARSTTDAQCPGSGASVASSGSWQTCELQEWYSTDTLPDPETCPTASCVCGDGGNDVSDFLSYRTNVTAINEDILQDPLFPCDLFEVYFGVPKADYDTIKSAAILIEDSDCDGYFSATTQSNIYWVTDSNGDDADCNLNPAGNAIGSPTNPVIIVSAAHETRLNSNLSIYGVLYIFDGEDSAASVRSAGDARVYGAFINDATLGQFQGTFSVIYSEGLLARAAGIGTVGAAEGGWRDFDVPDFSPN